MTSQITARRRFVLGTGLTGLGLLGGCGSLRGTRPEPPPYPALTNDARIRPLWQNRVVGEGGVGFAPLRTSDGLWVADTSGQVVLLDPGKGRVRGSVRVSQPLAAGVGADEDLVCVATRQGEILGLGRDGRLLWGRVAEGEVVTPPLVTPRSVVVRTTDGRILSLDRQTGSVDWTFQRPPPALTLQQSSPILYRSGTVYAGLPGGRMVALDARFGIVNWETVVAVSRGSNELDRLVDIVGSPARSDDGLCMAAYQGRVACLDEGDGRVLWSREGGSSGGPGASAAQLAVFDGRGVLRSYDQRGTLLWTRESFLYRGATAPVVTDRRVVFGDRDGSVHFLDARTGQPLARIEPDGSPVDTPPVLDGDRIWVLTRRGTVMALEA